MMSDLNALLNEQIDKLREENQRIRDENQVLEKKLIKLQLKHESLSSKVCELKKEGYKTKIEVAEGAICRDVVDLEPVGVGNSFTAAVGKLYCFTKIAGALSPIEISHVWYFGDTERAKIDLAVRSSSWRTFSSKRTQSHEIGDWHMDVLGPEGEVLRTLRFKITP